MFKKFIVAYDHNADGKYIQKIKEVLSEKGIAFEVLTDDDKANDYPLLAKRAYETYVEKKADGMVLLCGTGIGMNVVANKYDGIRAVLATSEAESYFARRHENANTIVFGAGYSDDNYEIKLCRRKMARMLTAFVETEFQGEERHKRRIAQIAKIEELN